MSRRWYFGVLALGIFIGVWAATQYTAHVFAHQPALGHRLFAFQGWQFYEPWAFIAWARNNAERWPQAFRGGFTMIMAGALVPTLAMGLTRFRQAPKVREIGRESWGTWFDAKKAGLTSGAGVVLGKLGKVILIFAGMTHGLISGASQSGKGVGLVIPTLLTWLGSILVYDIKGELWELTAGYRATLGHVAFFNPTRADSLHWNPLWEIRKGACEIRDVQNLVEILVGPSDSDGDDSFWDNAAEELLTGLILHVLYAEPDDRKHLGRVRELLMDLEATAKAMKSTLHVTCADGRPRTHPEVERVAGSILGASERTRSSIRLTAQTYLKLWADPLVCELTSRSDLHLGQLMSAEQPVTLYLQPPPSDADRLRPLIRLFFNMAGRALLEDLKRDNRGNPKRHPLLMLIDEFPSLGRMPFLAESLRKAAGYGVKCLLVCQSFNDIIAHYGPANTIIDNCHILVAFASADTVTQERISKMSGTVVEYRESHSRPTFLLGSGTYSTSHSEHLRPLLTPGDVRELPCDEELIFVTGSKPFRAKKVRYYQEKVYVSRLLPAPEVQEFPGGAVFDFAGEQPKGETKALSAVQRQPARAPAKPAPQAAAEQPQAPLPVLPSPAETNAAFEQAAAVVTAEALEPDDGPEVETEDHEDRDERGESCL